MWEVQHIHVYIHSVELSSHINVTGVASCNWIKWKNEAIQKRYERHAVALIFFWQQKKKKKITIFNRFFVFFCSLHFISFHDVQNKSQCCHQQMTTRNESIVPFNQFAIPTSCSSLMMRFFGRKKNVPFRSLPVFLTVSRTKQRYFNNLRLSVNLLQNAGLPSNYECIWIGFGLGALLVSFNLENCKYTFEFHISFKSSGLRKKKKNPKRTHQNIYTKHFWSFEVWFKVEVTLLKKWIAGGHKIENIKSNPVALSTVDCGLWNERQKKTE